MIKHNYIMPNLFLTDTQKENISKYKYVVDDNSLTTYLFSRFWRYLETFFPDYVAPNIISIAGLLVVIYGWHMCQVFNDSDSFMAGIFVIISLLVYSNLDAIDGIHARVTGNSSPMGELIDHGCDSITAIFIGLISCKILGITNNISMWYITNSLCLMFQNAHLNALVNGTVSLGRFTGPFEGILYFCIMIVLKIMNFKIIDIIVSSIDNYSHIIYFSVVLGNIIYTNYTVRKIYNHTANGCTLIYLLSAIRAYFISHYPPTQFVIFADGMVLSAITCDLMTSKMAKKNISQFVVLLSLISQIDSILPVLFSLCLMIGYVYEISDYMDLPILTTNINVYCCGVFDLCHNGHKKMFENAIKYGNRLIVGIHNDTDVASYKRTPIMTHEERCTAVENCKYVSKIIPNAHLVTTEQDIIDNNIHIVVCSDEYFDDPNDKYYSVPRNMGILRKLPYSKEISTSELIRRANTKDQH